jgi:4-hydroxy-3-methylbut-2-enyl diphosphate reductase
MQLKQLKVGKFSGFCYGVKRAIKIAEDAIKNGEAYCIGPLIHNPYVVKELESLGLKVIDKWQDLKECTVVIRSHGISPEIVTQLRMKDVRFIDATCPNVIAIQSIVTNIIKKDYDYCIIVGDARHPEVQGLLGFCKGKGIVVDTIKRLNKRFITGKRIGIVSQTTGDPATYFEIVKKIFDYRPLQAEVFNTICEDVIRRQLEAAELSKQVHTMIVLGGRASANTKRLVKICKKYCKKILHLEGNEELPDSLKKVKIIGITSGASTPQDIVKKTVEEIIKQTANGVR